MSTETRDRAVSAPAIRIPSNAAEMCAIGRLRYEVLVAEMGRPEGHTDHENRTILEPMDGSGLLFGAFDGGGEAVGAIRANLVGDEGIDEEPVRDSRSRMAA